MTSSAPEPAEALNPYVVGGALNEPQGFFGRDDIFEFVRKALLVTRRAPVLLFGQRRIGKSSILKQLHRHLPSELVCVYFDLQGKAQMELDAVLYGLGRAIADALHLPRPEREEATEERFPEFLRRAIAALDERPERLVLLFDEFDVIDQTFTGPEIAANRFVPYLAGLVESYPGVGHVMVVGRKTEELSEGMHGALLKDSVQRRIGRLSPEYTTRLVAESARGHLAFSDAAIERVIELAAGHPFCTQVLCHQIWNEALGVRGAREPHRIEREQVDAAVPAAIDLGANGLNWIYDGLDKPAHRLFLAALAAAQEPGDVDRWSTLDAIDRFLRARGVSVDAQDLEGAPRALVSWDVIVRGEKGFRFAVPMIGAWIRANRPLGELKQDARLANPRAFKYYELALESLGQDQYDTAISDFQSAIEAHPAFIEALRGLATALSRRRRRGDVDLAIEAHERALAVDPGSPRGALLDLLRRSLGAAGMDKAWIQARYTRIQALDPDGPVLADATRHLQEKARRYLEDGSPVSLGTAKELFALLGDEKNRRAAEAQRSRQQVIAVALLTSTSAAVLLAINPEELPVGRFPEWLRVSFAALGGTLWSLVDSTFATRWRRVPVGFLVGAGSGLLVLWLAKSLVGGSIVAIVLSLFVTVALTTVPHPPVKEPTVDEALLPAGGSQRTLAQLIGNLESALRSLRLRILR